MVTIRLRVRVTDPEMLFATARASGSRVVEVQERDPELALTLAVQDAVLPPDVEMVPGLSRRDIPPPWASVTAEPWHAGLDSV